MGNCSTHISNYHFKRTTQSMGGWLISCGNFPTTIGCSYSWIWSNLQDFYVAKLQIRQNMKLHLGTLQPALAWILLLWFQGHWGNGGNDYHINTCTMYYNMSCFVGSLKISFISQLGVAMKFVACWLDL
jgi:hypothetical protein